jgi:hypothetical protein
VATVESFVSAIVRVACSSELVSWPVCYSEQFLPVRVSVSFGVSVRVVAYVSVCQWCDESLFVSAWACNFVIESACVHGNSLPTFLIAP